MNIHTASVAELTLLQWKGAQWLCVAAYAHGGHERGDVLSWHKSYDAAARAAGSSEWLGLNELHYVLQDRKIFEAIVEEASR